MDESDSSAGPSTHTLQGEEVDVEWLQLIKTSHDSSLRVSESVDLSSLPPQCSLLAISNTWGLLCAGGSNDIRIHRLHDLHVQLEGTSKDEGVLTPIQTLPLPGRPTSVKLAHNDEYLSVVLGSGGGLLLWRIRDVLQGNTNPYHTFSQIPADVLDVIPNPAGPSDSLSNLVAVVTTEGVAIADADSQQLSATIPGRFTCGSWSAKGKQVVLGSTDGTLAQYTPDGTRKVELPKPPSLEGSYYPTSVQWLETDLFLASYALQDAAPDDALEVFLIQRTKTSCTFTQFFDPLNTMGNPTRSGAFRYFASLRSWGDSIKHLAFIMSGSATEVGVLRGGADKWEALILDETARAIMPMRKRGATEDPSCIGLALDLTSDKPIKRGIVGGVEQPDLPPAPRLLLYTQDGSVISYNILNSDAGPYPEMVKPADILSAGSSTVASTIPASSEPPKPSSGFGAFSNQSSGPGFGAKAFGSPSAPTSFGSSAFGQPAKPTPTPAFGGASTTAASTSAFGQASSPAAFGQSAFGQPATPASSASPSSSAPAFGQSSTPSAFGQSAFGAAAKPAFGASAFGASSMTPSGGFGAFAASAPTGFSFGGSTTPSSTSQTKPSAPAFGAVTGGSAFGSSSAFGGGSAFGSSAFGKPAFGQRSTSTPAQTNEQKPAFGGFGQTSSSSSSGFGGFGQQAVKPAQPQPTTSAAGGDDFGLGGFASALEPSKSTIVPGLEDSPPPSPTSKAGRVPGLDDDSPPSTPSFKPAQPKPQAQAPASSSFIKPATAFGGSSSGGGFGAFNSTPSSTPAKSPSAFGSTPAFGTPSSASTATNAASPAFGKPSAIGSTPSPAFGASAFGKPSAISGGTTAFGASAFGQPSKPAASSASAFGSTGPITNISGGFGAFAASSGTAGASSGFAGFGKPSATGSAFGSVKSSGGGFGALLSGNKGESASTAPSAAKPAEAEERSATTPASPKEKTIASSPRNRSGPLADVAQPPQDEAKGYDVPSSTSVKTTDGTANSRETTTSSPEGSPTPSPTSPPAAHVEEPPTPPADLSSTVDSLQVVDADDDSDEEYDEVGAAEEEDEEGDESALTEEGAEGEAEEAVGDEAAVEDEDEEDYDDDEGEYDEDDENGEEGAEDYDGEEHLAAIEESPSEESESTAKTKAVESETKGDSDAKDIAPSATPAATMKDEGSSQLDRVDALSSAPTQAPATATAKQAAPAFSWKHATRTSSPLGSQPPQNADASTSPESTPPKAAASTGSSSFASFGQPKAAPPTSAPGAPISATAPAKSGFSFGTSSSANKASELSAAPPSLFGSTPAPPSTTTPSFFAPKPTAPVPEPKVASPPSLFAPSKQAPPCLFTPNASQSQPPPAQPKAPFGGGLGLGRPPALPTTTTPAQPSIPAPPPSAPSTFSLPARPTPVSAPARKEGGDQTMAGVLERMIMELTNETKALRATLDAQAKYHAALNTSFAELTPDILAKNAAVPLSSAAQISKLADQSRQEVVALRKQDVKSQNKLGEIQSRMIKTDLKMAHLQRLSGSPESATASAAEEGLGPQQLVSQTRMRQTLQAVETNLEQLELAVSNLKRGSGSSRRPSSLSSGAEYETALQSRADALEELSVRVARMGLGTPSKAAIASTSSGRYASPLRGAHDQLEVPPEVASAARTAARSQIDNAEKLKLRLKGMKTQQTIVPARAPPRARSTAQTQQQTSNTPASSQNAPRPDTAPSPSSFAGLSFSLDPNAGGASPPSNSTRTSRGSGGGGSNRQHAPAAKFQPSSTPSSSAPPAGNAGGGFSFGWPSAALAGEKDRKATPQGFVGFGGFSKK